MFEYFFFKSFATIFFAFPLTFSGTIDIDKSPQKIEISLATSKNRMESQTKNLSDYLPKNEKRSQIWSYIFSKKKELSICNHEGAFFDREFEKNRYSQYNIFRIDENKFLVEVKCFWASYQGNYEFFTYENSGNEVILNRLSLRRFTRNEDGSLTEIYNKSVGGIPKYDPENKTLRLFARAGGGDCGSYLAQYKYEDNSLKLLVLGENYECIRRVGVYNPDQYPIIYSAPDK